VHFARAAANVGIAGATDVQAGAVRGFVDLHCHWIAGIDDGAPSPAEGLAMLRALRGAGFDFVMATPHMRPAMFDNEQQDLRRAFEAMGPVLCEPGLPEVGLSSEHYFDDIVFGRMMAGQALPYPGNKAVLVEFPTDAFPAQIVARFFDLRVKGLRPVLAHPERYRPVWKDPAVLDPLLDGGAVLLLDVASLVGRYGRATERAALKLLEEGYYEAACSDAHRAEDVDQVARGIERLRALEGPEETEYLLREGPLAILKGKVES
jgi:protein-tyrosine phosphatase